MKGSRVKGAVLGMLVEHDRPTHAYHLGTLINRRLGPAAEIDRESIYKLLRVLDSRGLVDCSERENPDGGGWQRQRVYSANEATRDALSRWMETAVSDADFRSELHVKIVFSRPSDAPTLLRSLDVYERVCVKRLATCKEAMLPVSVSSSWTALAMGVSRNASEEHLAAELRWIATTRDWINGYLAEQATVRR
jgi:DNA-binding PadR family transcriptional regulator